MKKVALSLLALALVGAGAFAQEAPALKIGGYLDTGVKVYNKADSGTSSQVVGDDTGKDGGSYEFKLSYGTDKSGVNLRVRAEDLAAKTYSFYPRTAYAWFLVPGAEAVKVVGGNTGDDGLVGNGLDDEGDKLTGGNGLGAVASVGDSFKVGAAVLASSSASILVPSYAAGVEFSVPGTVQVNAALLTGAADKDQKAALKSVGVTAKLLLDGPLSLSAGANLYQLQADKATGYNIFDVLAGYAVTDALSASLKTYVYTYGADNKYLGKDTANVSFKVTPGVMYTVDPVIAVGAEATYQQGSGNASSYTKAGATAAQIAALGVTGDTIVPLNKFTGIEIKPKATFTIDPNTKVLVFYAYDMLSGDDVTTDKTQSTISIETRYSF